MIKIGRYILTKTDAIINHRNAHWSCNGYKLSLETAIDSYSQNMMKQMDFCLLNAHFFGQMFRSTGDSPRQLRVSHILNDGLNYVLRIVWLESAKTYHAILILLANQRADFMNLSVHQRAVLANITYNIGLEHLQNASCRQALVWLKYSHSLAKSNPLVNCNVEPLLLLAYCLFQLDVGSNRWHILHHLDCTNQSLMNRQLELTTLLSTKTDVTTVVSSTIHFLKTALLLVEQSADEMREHVIRVFTTLKHHQQLEVSDEILDHISAGRLSDCSESGEKLARVQWICVQYAVWCCLKNRHLLECYQRLAQLEKWQPIDKGNVQRLKMIIKFANSCPF